MKALADVVDFGGTDADNDDLLLRAFEGHEAYESVLAMKRHMVIGRKGSGKTAIFKKLITTREPTFFSYGHTFSDYPWHHHELQARSGIPDFDKYTHSWKYLILLSAAKIALNQDSSLPFNHQSMEDMIRLEAFVVDTYGSRDPDLTQTFSPTKALKLRPHFEIDLKLFSAGVSPESVPVRELPTIVTEVNAAFLKTVLRCLNPAHKYFIAFDQLDLGFDLSTNEYSSRLIGLLLAARDINLAARETGIGLFCTVFLRDDIYETLHFEDKNKMTENYVSVIEWDTQRTGRTLRGLMQRRFEILLADAVDPQISWEQVVSEKREMPGHQSKYEHMRDRTYLRPRDMIKFANEALVQYKSRILDSSTCQEGDLARIDNVDVHNARPEYSRYLQREIDDEVHKHLPQYARYLDVLRALGKWQFDRTEFSDALNQHYSDCELDVGQSLERLYAFSFVGFYQSGGRGFGGSEYSFCYRDPRTKFDSTASRFRIHPGLIECLGVKRK